MDKKQMVNSHAILLEKYVFMSMEFRLLYYMGNVQGFFISMTAQARED